MAEDFANEEALEATDDLGFALPLEGPSLDVVEGGLVAAHSHDDDAVEGCIGLAMVAAIETMPAGLAARGRNGADATQFGQRRLRADALRVISNKGVKSIIVMTN